MYFIKLLLTQLLARKGQLIAAGKVLSVSVLNQVVSSGTNFALGIYLMQMLPPVEFGLYSIGFTISLFYAGIGNALFLTQMVVHTPNKEPDDRLPYAFRMFLLLTLFCIAIVLFSALILLMSSILWEFVARYFQFAVAVIAASITYLLKDFFVRHAYNVRRESWALAIHGAIASSMAMLLWLQHQFVIELNMEMALWTYSFAQVSGILIGCQLVKLPAVMQQRSILFGDLREAWLGGKWAIINNLLFFARTQAHTIVVATFLGPLGVANLNVSRLLVTPAIMLIPALGQVAMPRLATAYKAGRRCLINSCLFINFFLLLFMIFYCSILLIEYDFIKNKIFGEKYQDLFLITIFWCLYACFLAIRIGAEMVGEILNRFKRLSWANMLTAIISLSATYILVIFYGSPGSLIGICVGEIVLIFLIIRILIMPI